MSSDLFWARGVFRVLVNMISHEIRMELQKSLKLIAKSCRNAALLSAARKCKPRNLGRKLPCTCLLALWSESVSGAFLNLPKAQIIAVRYMCYSATILDLEEKLLTNGSHIYENWNTLSLIFSAMRAIRVIWSMSTTVLPFAWGLRTEKISDLSAPSHIPSDGVFKRLPSCAITLRIAEGVVQKSIQAVPLYARTKFVPRWQMSSFSNRTCFSGAAVRYRLHPRLIRTINFIEYPFPHRNGSKEITKQTEICLGRN